MRRTHVYELASLTHTYEYITHTEYITTNTE